MCPTLIETLLFSLGIALFDMKNGPNRCNRWTSTSQCLSTEVYISLIITVPYGPKIQGLRSPSVAESSSESPKDFQFISLVVIPSLCLEQ